MTKHAAAAYGVSIGDAKRLEARMGRAKQRTVQERNQAKIESRRVGESGNLWQPVV
jgi:hypothetical protein